MSSNTGIPAGDENLTITLHVTNLLPDQEALIQMRELTVNGTAVDVDATAYGMGENWGLLPQETQMLTASVPGAAIPQAEEISDLAFSLALLDAKDESVVLGTVPVTVTIHSLSVP